MKKLGSATDPQWYKDAVIYEIHVRAFADSNNDGVGDFQGLISRLDYLQDLGVTCLWLLPFFPSPLRDDGYDIADYVSVNPAYGTLEDFQQFLNAAHQRNMQVMIELVINHSSDQHPWFQAARHAPKGSPERAMYVWSDTDKLYDGVRIIFTDTEKSNWTWDEVAQQFYWHRFFSHQPDLNFDNPRVMEEVLNAMRFWMDMGVDGLRLDAIPYLLERDGTSCENVPETHDKIKAIRAAIDAEYDNRLVLAEANMWPEDVRPYFGDGDECHMAFHFPLMPRIYMALRQEDRLPITDIMAQTPEIPDNCQWGLFLRNHDELTLEMVTDDERDYMNLAYASDARMRINVGIRRRLAPLLDNNRRRIELLNSLLLSFPGTPILYYGDEIGMGDNIYLGDRNGVRTPMQWNSDRNAGFSRCDPARLYFPVIMDPTYGYQVVNVEAQLADQSSLLHWMRNMIALRKLFQVFGRGTLRFLQPENRKILAYLRTLGRGDDNPAETVLCVANLSRFAQPVALDLSEFAGLLPVEMIGYVPFPEISAAPYVLTVAPYSFLWFELQPQSYRAPNPAATSEADAVAARAARELAANGWRALAQGPGLALLEAALPAWLPRQRWFGAKTRPVAGIRVLHCATLPLDPVSGRTGGLLYLEVHYATGMTETYQLPLALSTADGLAALEQSAPQSIVATLPTDAGQVALYDATRDEAARQALLALITGETTLPAGHGGTISGEHSAQLSQERATEEAASRVGAAEQSNTSMLFGRTLILKLFRRLEPGPNPDVEIGRFLTEVAHFERIPTFLGELTLDSPAGAITTGLLQSLVANEGDGWSWTAEELQRFFEDIATCPQPHNEGRPARLFIRQPVSRDVADRASFYLDAAATLGRRTAEMHLALATPTDDPAFAAEPFQAADLEADAHRIDRQINVALEALKAGMVQLKDLISDDAATLLSRRIELFSRAHAIVGPAASGMRIRIHGDYHLGQTLRTRNDFVLLDFEGEPARSLDERRAKQSPLRDVAGMLRSFSYAAGAALDTYLHRYPERQRTLEAWTKCWLHAVSERFLDGYTAALPATQTLLPEPAQAESLLAAYQLEKALYELLYELNNRPAWVGIPLKGLIALLEPTVPSTIRVAEVR